MSARDRARQNRQNPQHSTRPESPDGKANSRLSALMDGFRASIQVLPAEYVVNTSDYASVRNRWLAMANQRKIHPAANDATQPTLRRAPGSSSPESGKDDDRPTIKRRDLVE